MASYNKVVLVGNLTRDVELKYVGANGTAVTELGLAVNEKYKKGDEFIEEVVFVDCVCWGRTAEIASEYCSKGSQVLIDGRLKLESWEKDGQKHYKLKVVVEQFKMLGGKKDGDSAPKQQQQPKPQQNRQQPQKPAPVVNDADIAF